MNIQELNSRIGGDVSLKTRIGFVVELSRRLHEYGTTAPRLEDVINLVSARLGLVCNVLSTPTSIVMSFSDPGREDGLAEITQVVRVSPGDVNLKRLCQVDEIADQVIDGHLDLEAGRARLKEFGEARRSSAYRAWLVASFGVSAGSIALILHTGWSGVAVASLIGLMIGMIYHVAAARPNIAAAADALSAFLATLIATAIAVHVTPL
ncbi:MAG: threonine/serine exporter family protein, partial [Dokdonella sp.]